MTDISALGIKVTSDGVVKTTNELTAFSKAASAARQSASKPLNIKVGNTGIAKALADIQKLDRALKGMGGRGNASSAKLNVTGGAAAIRQINAFAKAVTDARAKVGTDITVQLRVNGSQAAIRNIQSYQQAVNQAQSAASRGANFNMSGGGSGAGGAATAGISGLTKALAGLLTVTSALAAGRYFLKLADESNMLSAKLRLATAETGQFSVAMADVQRIAAATRSDLDATGTLYQRLMMNSKELGLTQAEVARVTENVGKSFKISGASTVEAIQGTRQLIQALQSGVLRGDEFNTVMESAPRLAKAFADGLGVPVSALREMAAEGEITSQQMTQALLKASEALDKEFATLPVTFSDAMGQVYNAAVITFGAFDQGGEFSKAISNFVLGGSKDFAEMENSAKRLGASVRIEIAGIVGAFNEVADAVRTVSSWFEALGNTRLGGWVGEVISQMNTLANAMNPVMAALRFIRSFTTGPAAMEAKRAESGRLMARDVADNITRQFEEQRKAAEKLAPAIANVTKKKDKADKSSQRLADRLERERKATEALIAGNYEIFEAYKKSNAEAVKAEIMAKALSDGTKKRADVTAYVAQQLRLAVSERVKDSAAMINSLDRETSAQMAINKQIAEGTLTYERAGEALEIFKKKLDLEDTLKLAIDSKDTAAIKAATEALQVYELAQRRVNDERRKFADGEKADQLKQELPLLRQQIDLEQKIGKARMDAMRTLTGTDLENRLVEINNYRERESVILEFNAKIDEARRKGQVEYIDQLKEEMALRLKMVGVQQGNATKERTFEQNRALTLALANDVANLIGGKLGDTFSRLIQVLDEAFTDLAADLGKKFGHIFKAFSAGMQTGGAFGALTGSRTGGSLGGGLGQMAGEALAPMLGKLGSFAGPLGAIAGGILGGVIGGLMKSTPRASATVSIIAGEAMETAIKGSSDKLKKAAGQMANGIIDGLTSLADQLGAQLIGDANVSIGMRKKNYRVDPTGQGITKTSKGAIDFGEDQAAAIAYAMQVAIQQGVLGGLSESMKRLIMADGDLQTQISKALSFKGVFDELAQNDDPAKWAQDEITRWRENMDKIFKEAGATADELAELERLTGIKRAKAAEEAAEKIAQAEREALDRQREIRDKNIELLEAQGKIEEAEAMARQARIDDAPEYLRSIQQAIEAANMLRDAEDKLAERRAIAKQNAQTMFGLEERLQAAMGNDAEVKRLQRENELRNAADALTRSYLLQIYAAEDLATSNAAALAAQEEAAAKLKAIADERYGLEGRLLELQGDTAALRQRELEALDPANRALLEMIFSLTDLATEAEKAKAAAEALAQAQKDIADEIDSLSRRWLEVTGQVGALRDLQLGDLLSDEAREIQRNIWAYEDAMARQSAAQEAATAAMEDYARRLDDARNALSSAYERESGALQSTIDRFKDFSSAIKEFRDGLIGSGNPAFSLAQARSTFSNTSRMAALGNEASFSSFTTDAQAYLDAARNTGTYEEYQRAMASVLSGSGSAIRSADSMVSMAQRQLDQMTGIMDTLGLIRDDNVSFNESLIEYNRVLNEEVMPDFAETISVSIDRMGEKIDDASYVAKQASEKSQVALETQAFALNQIMRYLGRAERDGSFAVTLDGEKVQIDGVVLTQGNVIVTNTPLPVDQV